MRQTLIAIPTLFAAAAIALASGLALLLLSSTARILVGGL